MCQDEIKVCERFGKGVAVKGVDCGVGEAWCT